MKRYIFGKSVQGASHKRTGKECQDSRKVVTFPDGTAIVAIADGHGSAACPFSKNGSTIAVNVFCDVMQELYHSYAQNKEMLLTYLNRDADTQLAQTIDEEWKARVLRFHLDAGRDTPEFEDEEKNKEHIYTLYGSTLVGMLLTPTFIFAFQIGDGDISYVDQNGFSCPMEADKMYGVETHSLCRPNAWKKAVTMARRWNGEEELPTLLLLSTDGFANSYPSDEAFRHTCIEYFEMIKEHGPKTISAHLDSWLNETSAGGCGDDITLMLVYTCAHSDNNKK